MLDHAGFPVSDYKRSKAFYEKALAPLGYVLGMEVPQTENDTPAAGFGIDRKPDFWIGGWRTGLTPTLPPELLCGLRIRSRRPQHRSGLSFAPLKGMGWASPITSAFAFSAQAYAAAAR
jgi:catechol 2,3-dioxygenase-like lactoylglutathione lyase family enzyme